MGLSIHFSPGISWALMSVNKSQKSMFLSLERLSTGLRINRASDNPAGLIISEKLRTQIASLTQEIENASAQISRYETASSAVSGLRSMLTELRTLAINAANEGGNSEAAQAAIATTADHLVASYNRNIETATFNGSNLIDGSARSVADVDQLTEIDLSTAQLAEEALAKIDEAIAAVDDTQINLGATIKNDLESRRASLEVTRSNLEAAESQIRDTDMALEISNFIALRIRNQAAWAMLAQLNVSSQSVISLIGAGKN